MTMKDSRLGERPEMFSWIAKALVFVAATTAGGAAAGAILGIIGSSEPTERGAALVLIGAATAVFVGL